MKRNMRSLIAAGVVLLALLVLAVMKRRSDRLALYARLSDPLYCSVFSPDPESKEVIRIMAALPDDAEHLVKLISDHKHPEAKVAAIKLRRLGKSALASLVSHAQDDHAVPACMRGFEYITVKPSERHSSMGYWCVWEINKMIEYHEASPLSTITSAIYAPHLVSQDNANEWWEKRKNWTLRDMRIEAIKWQMNMILTNSQYAMFTGAVNELERRLQKIGDTATETAR